LRGIGTPVPIARYVITLADQIQTVGKEVVLGGGSGKGAKKVFFTQRKSGIPRLNLCQRLVETELTVEIGRRGSGIKKKTDKRRLVRGVDKKPGGNGGEERRAGSRTGRKCFAP